MGRKKAGGIIAAVIALVVLVAVFIPAKAKNPQQEEKPSVLQQEDTRAREAGGADWQPDFQDDVPWEEEEAPEEIAEEDFESFEPEGSLLMSENFDYAADTFGFDAASVKDGALSLTEHMQNLETSVKKFDHVIMGQSFVELSFDWKAEFSGTKGKSGLEFRDLYGRLVFAVSAGYSEKTGQYGFFYSAAGAAVNSPQVTVEPRWTAAPYRPGAVYRVFFRADFVTGKVKAVIRDENDTVVGAVKEADTDASGLAEMTAACYASGASGMIDNFKLYGPDDAGPFPLAGKRAIAFGDSIVDGHLYKAAGFVEFLAEKEGMVLEYNYANNGARIMPGSTVNEYDGLGGTILDCQVNAAALDNRNPDYIIFDGGANDAYSDILKKLGTAGDTAAATFAGAFRGTIRAMHNYWPDAKIVYVAVHKLSVREIGIQEELRRLELAICADMGVEVADLYTRGWDTTDAAMNQKYAFDAFDSGQIPIAGDHPTGAHPNFLAIEELYVPVVSDALKRAKDVTIADSGYDSYETPDSGSGFEDFWDEPGDTAVDGKVTSIRFSSAKYQIAAGKSITLIPKVEPSDALDKGINWQVTSNKKYVSVEVLGDRCEVATKKAGAGKTVTITAEAADGSGTRREVKISLMKHAVKKIQIKGAKKSLKAGEKILLKASVKTTGKKANKKLVWTSSDKNTVTLKPNKDGSQCMVTAKAAGAGRTVTITAQATDGTGQKAEIAVLLK